MWNSPASSKKYYCARFSHFHIETSDCVWFRLMRLISKHFCSSRVVNPPDWTWSGEMFILYHVPRFLLVFFHFLQMGLRSCACRRCSFSCHFILIYCGGYDRPPRPVVSTSGMLWCREQPGRSDRSWIDWLKCVVCVGCIITEEAGGAWMSSHRPIRTFQGLLKRFQASFKDFQGVLDSLQEVQLGM